MPFAKPISTHLLFVSLPGLPEGFTTQCTSVVAITIDFVRQEFITTALHLRNTPTHLLQQEREVTSGFAQAKFQLDSKFRFSR